MLFKEALQNFSSSSYFRRRRRRSSFQRSEVVGTPDLQRRFAFFFFFFLFPFFFFSLSFETFFNRPGPSLRDLFGARQLERTRVRAKRENNKNSQNSLFFLSLLLLFHDPPPKKNRKRNQKCSAPSPPPSPSSASLVSSAMMRGAMSLVALNPGYASRNSQYKSTVFGASDQLGLRRRKCRGMRPVPLSGTCPWNA